MESRVKAFGHPIHPMLIVFPLGLLATAVIFDILYIIFNNANFPVASYWMMIAGIIGGLIAAVFGLAEWLSIPGGTRAKSLGLMHGGGNVVVVALFAISWIMRLFSTGHVPSPLALIFSFAGAILALFTGWLGGELVFRLGVGEDRGANLDAPSSLSGQPAAVRSGGYVQGLAPTGRPDDKPEDEEHH